MRVLIVDDDPRLCEAMRRNFRRGGIAVITAGSVNEAWNLLNLAPFDVVVADYHLTGEATGFDLLERVAADFPGTRRILMTGSSERGPRPGVVEAMLEKPFAHPTLVNLLQAAVTASRGHGYATPPAVTALGTSRYAS